MSVKVQHRLFTVDDYYRMAEAGILKEDDRVELIDGEIITMSPIGNRHSKSDRMRMVHLRIWSAATCHRFCFANQASKRRRVAALQKLPSCQSHKFRFSCVMRLIAIFGPLAGKDFILTVQNPVRLDNYSEPQPDMALLKPRSDYYSQSHPTPSDVLLIIEVSDTTLAYDRMIKVPLYARAGIPEVWIANLTGDEVEAYSEPVNGSYQRVRRAARGALFDAGETACHHRRR